MHDQAMIHGDLKGVWFFEHQLLIRLLTPFYQG